MRVVKNGVLSVLATAAWCAIAPAALAQHRGTVVICPTIYEGNGTSAARQAAVTCMENDLRSAGYTVIPYGECEHSWDSMTLPTLTSTAPAMESDLVRFGDAMHARYVIAPTIDVHTRTRWAGLSRRTESRASVSIRVVNVPDKREVYATTSTFDRTKHEPGTAPLRTRTAREDKAIDIAVNDALNGWMNRTS